MNALEYFYEVETIVNGHVNFNSCIYFIVAEIHVMPYEADNMEICTKYTWSIIYESNR